MGAVDRFLSARALDDRPADVVIQGVAYDGGVSWRPGAADGPGAIRTAADSIESYTPLLKRDLEDLNIADAGDVRLDGATGAAMVSAVARATEQLASTGALVVTLGGDHSVSMGTSTGLRRVHEDLAHVVFDAHLDMRSDYEGDAYSHACGTRRMAHAGPTGAFGIRSGSREEFDEADRSLVTWSEECIVNDRMRAAIGERPVFVSVDLDVLDPSIFPGTGNPEPAGAAYRELREAILSLEGFRVVGIDLVELAPRFDASGVSAVIAAELARDGILGLVGARAR